MCGMQMSLLCIPAEHCDWGTRSRLLCSGEAIHLVDVAAGDSQCGVVPADCSFVQTFMQAIHFPFRIVVQLDLAYAELAGLRVAGVLGDLRDGLGGQHQVRESP
jgi:hypothetical protein